MADWAPAGRHLHIFRTNKICRYPAHPSNLLKGGLRLYKGFFATSTLLVSIFVIAVPVVFGQSKDQIGPTLTTAQRGFTEFPPHGRSGSIMPIAGGSGTPKQGQFDSIRTFNCSSDARLRPTGAPALPLVLHDCGGRPQDGGTTRFDAPIIPVSVDLLDWDKSVRVVKGHKLHYSVKPFIEPVLNSPVFQNFDYTSSDVPHKFADAVQREFLRGHATGLAHIAGPL